MPKIEIGPLFAAYVAYHELTQMRSSQFRPMSLELIHPPYEWERQFPPEESSHEQYAV